MSSPFESCTISVWVWVPWFGYATLTSPLATEYCFWSTWISSAMTVRFGLAGAVGVELDEPPPPPQAARARAGTRAKRQARRDVIAAPDATGRHPPDTGAGSIDGRGRR